jgi:thiol:disulfide interchange protein DsbG
MKSRQLAWLGIVSIGVFSAANAQQSPVLLDQMGAKASPAVPSSAALAAPGLRDAESAVAMVSRYGTIVDSRPVGAGGLVAWTVEKNGRTVELYTTPDMSVIFTGIIWDAKTGKNISDQFLPSQALPTPGAPTAATVAASAPPPEVGAVEGTYKGAIPESVKAVASLQGIQEGKGDQGNTVYIMFDPRCHYCHDAYALTRKYVKKGYSIKWIPTLALGEVESGAPVAAAIMQAKDSEQVLAQTMTGMPVQPVAPNNTTMKTLGTNLSYLFAAFQNSGQSDRAGVPVAFYVDHHTGKATMMQGVSSQIVLDKVFGTL